MGKLKIKKLKLEHDPLATIQQKQEIKILLERTKALVDKSPEKAAKILAAWVSRSQKFKKAS